MKITALAVTAFLLVSAAQADVILSVEHRIPTDLFTQLQHAFEAAHKQAQNPETSEFAFFAQLTDRGQNIPISLVCRPGAPFADGSGCEVMITPEGEAQAGQIRAGFSLPIREDDVVKSNAELRQQIATQVPAPGGEHLHVLKPFFKGEDVKDSGTHVYCAPEILGDMQLLDWQCYLSVAQRF